ncbi:hypothetical protein BV22DRAFT_1200265 [Leucogyrophana mollusca]|uniref:Uncharacterized protein n=1 Tax=Leucogyrophana mollusca TaxID=85980 RepID=A0ACB8AWM4_9AGAM|nr:hypothetical protein BV22DRAFT_1200265 [Leucogyrophana mollusca]
MTFQHLGLQISDQGSSSSSNAAPAANASPDHTASASAGNPRHNHHPGSTSRRSAQTSQPRIPDQLPAGPPQAPTHQAAQNPPRNHPNNPAIQQALPAIQQPAAGPAQPLAQPPVQPVEPPVAPQPAQPPNHAPQPAPQPAQPPLPHIAQHPVQQPNHADLRADRAAELLALKARIDELEREEAQAVAAAQPIAQALPHPLVADAATIEQARLSSATAKDEAKRPSLPPLQPGHKVSALSIPIPPKVDEAFKAYRYVPYTALTHAARSKAYFRGDDSSFVLTADGFVAKGLDRSNELSIASVDWLAAAKTAEEKTKQYWGQERADALHSHHDVVLDIGRMHSWAAAMMYDVQQRELAHANHDHNLTGLDTTALTVAISKLSFQSAPTPIPSSSSSSAIKRSAPNDFPSSPRKKSRIFCFRCGAWDHMPADCKAETTVTGRPTAALAVNAKSKHALASADGKHFCFNWARSSKCPYGANCVNTHACTICGDGGHGAGNCKAHT